MNHRIEDDEADIYADASYANGDIASTDDDDDRGEIVVLAVLIAIGVALVLIGFVVGKLT